MVDFCRPTLPRYTVGGKPSCVDESLRKCMGLKTINGFSCGYSGCALGFDEENIENARLIPSQKCPLWADGAT